MSICRIAHDNDPLLRCLEPSFARYEAVVTSVRSLAARYLCGRSRCHRRRRGTGRRRRAGLRRRAPHARRPVAAGLRRPARVIQPRGAGRKDAPPGERRLGGAKGEGTGFGPDIADGRGGDGVAAVATEDPAVLGGAEGVDMRAEDGDQLGWGWARGCLACGAEVPVRRAPVDSRELRRGRALP